MIIVSERKIIGEVLVFPIAILNVLRPIWSNRWVHLLVGALISISLGYLAADAIRWEDFIGAFANLPIHMLVLSIVPLVVAMFCRAVRWRVLLEHRAMSLWQVFLTQNTGIGMNNMLPIRMISEPVQLVLATKRYKVPFPVALTTLVGGNVLDIFATALILMFGLVLVPELREARVTIQFFGAFVMFVVSLLVFLVIARGIDSIPVARRLGFFHRLASAVSALKGQPLGLMASFIATLAHWIFMGFAAWVLANSFGIQIQPLVMITIVVAATFFTSAVPSLPGGAGTFHFAVVTMLTSLGAAHASALSLALVLHILIVLPTIAIAVAMISRVGFSFLLRREASTSTANRAVDIT